MRSTVERSHRRTDHWPSRPTSISSQASPASATRTSTHSRRIWRRPDGSPAATEDVLPSIPATNPPAARWRDSSRPSLRRSGSGLRSRCCLPSSCTTAPERAASRSTWLWMTGTPSTRTPPTSSTTSSTGLDQSDGEQQSLLLQRSRLQPEARRRRTAHRSAALPRLPGPRGRPLAQRSTRSTARELRRARVLLRPHRLPGLPAHLRDRPRRALSQASTLKRHTTAAPARFRRC